MPYFKLILLIFTLSSQASNFPNIGYSGEGDQIKPDNDQVLPVLKNGSKNVELVRGKENIPSLPKEGRSVKFKKMVNKGLEYMKGNPIESAVLGKEENRKLHKSESTKKTGEEIDKVFEDAISVSQSAQVRKEVTPERETRTKVRTKPVKAKRKIRRGPRIKKTYETYSLETETKKKNTVTLPSGSVAMGVLMAGLDLDEQGEQVDARLVGSFVGPNSSFVEMRNCHIWFFVKPKYNTSRIKEVKKTEGEFQDQRLTCRMTNGEVFTVPVKIQLRDASDEYVGLKGELNTINMEKAGIFDFLQGFSTAFGNAVSAANVTTSVTQPTQNFPSSEAANVTGSRAAYVTGQTIAGSTGSFLKRFSDFYYGLRPTVSVPPGTVVLLSIKRDTEVPVEFFKGSVN